MPWGGPSKKVNVQLLLTLWKGAGDNMQQCRSQEWMPRKGKSGSGLSIHGKWLCRGTASLRTLFPSSFHFGLDLQFYSPLFLSPENLKQSLEAPAFQDTHCLFHPSSEKGLDSILHRKKIIRSLKPINYICHQQSKQMEFLVLWWQWWMATLNFCY